MSQIKLLLAHLSEVPNDFIHNKLTGTQGYFSYKSHIYK